MTTRPQHAPARATAVPVESCAGVEAAIARFCRQREPAVLDTSVRDATGERLTILACDPVDRFEAVITPGTSLMASLRDATAKWPTASAPETPFPGGWIGYLTYEGGISEEGLVPRHGAGPPGPDAAFRLYDHAAVYDHGLETWHAVAIDWPEGVAAERPGSEDRLDRVRSLLLAAEAGSPTTIDAGHAEAVVNPADLSRDGFEAGVCRIRDYLAAGDVYQVNLSRRITLRTDLSPLALYLRSRRHNPSAFSAFLPWTHPDVISASPELFLRVEGDYVVTQPIKGTRPRVADPALDAAAVQDLESSPKDRAELDMIIDLMRNDLGRVCRFGTVQVTHPGRIETHPTVFHRVGTISGRLDSRHDLFDLIAACVPGGSVTGAPKVRAMEIIDELESCRRGVYCGNIGWIGIDGRATLNLAIRTMVLHDGLARVHVGGGIVADSDPADEYAETCAKATGMLRALTGSADALNRPNTTPEPRS